MTCPSAHKSCGTPHGTHTCWKKPGHTGEHRCACLTVTWKDR